MKITTWLGTLFLAIAMGLLVLMMATDSCIHGRM